MEQKYKDVQADKGTPGLMDEIEEKIKFMKVMPL